MTITIKYAVFGHFKYVLCYDWLTNGIDMKLLIMHMQFAAGSNIQWFCTYILYSFNTNPLCIATFYCDL